MAAAIGIIVDVPIIIRALADSMHLKEQCDADPLIFDNSFLAALDVGTHPDQPGHVIDDYEFAWWLDDSPCHSHYLIDHDDNLEKGMAAYQVNLKAAQERETPTDEARPKPPAREPPAVPTLPAPPIDPTNAHCDRCEHYKRLAEKLYGDMTGLQQFAAAMETSSSTRWNMDMRRASGFHMLHDASVAKETANTPRLLYPAPGHAKETRTGRISRHVRDNAEMERDRLESLPAASHKWTWGKSLTIEEVNAIRPIHCERPAQQSAHSGYLQSLPYGVRRGQSSAAHSDPAVDGKNDECSQQDIPPYNMSLPTYFANCNADEFDPLERSLSGPALPINSFTDAAFTFCFPAAAAHQYPTLTGSDNGEIAPPATASAADAAAAWGSDIEEIPRPAMASAADAAAAWGSDIEDITPRMIASAADAAAAWGSDIEETPLRTMASAADAAAAWGSDIEEITPPTMASAADAAAAWGSDIEEIDPPARVSAAAAAAAWDSDIMSKPPTISSDTDHSPPPAISSAAVAAAAWNDTHAAADESDTEVSPPTVSSAAAAAAAAWETDTEEMLPPAIVSAAHQAITVPTVDPDIEVDSDPIEEFTDDASATGSYINDTPGSPADLSSDIQGPDASMPAPVTAALADAESWIQYMDDDYLASVDMSSSDEDDSIGDPADADSEYDNASDSDENFT